MKLRIREVEREGPVDLTEDLRPETIVLDTPDCPQLEGPVKVKLAARIQDGVLWAWVDAVARIRLNCARCLDRYMIQVWPSFEVEAPLTDEFLDVTDEVRQQLLLALPAQPLCRNDCRGLCPTCGANRQGGPCGCPPDAGPTPFDVLKNLKLK